MSIEEIIENLHFFADKLRNGIFGDRVGSLYQAIEKLKTHPDIRPNEPLTLEELREMAGQPVWVEVLGGLADSGYGIVHLCPPPELAVPQEIRVFEGISSFEQIIPYPKSKKKQKYGRVWVAYRRPPEEETP